VDQAAVRGLARTARSFAERHILPVIEAEGRDGDLGVVPDVIDRAGELGITSSADPAGEGHEHGVWGTSSLGDGALGSLVMLEEIARVCAGVACCVHAVGLGSLELVGTGVRAPRAAVALEDDGWPIDASSIGRPWPGCAAVTRRGDGVAVSGLKACVWLPPGCRGFVVFAASEEGWERLYIPRTAPGVTIVGGGSRTGLAAVDIAGLLLENVRIRESSRLPAGAPTALLRRHLLGIAAIAVGNARGALDAARRYTADRYQGGGQIEAHPAVRLLLGEAASKIEAGAAHLRAAGEEATVGEAGLRLAASAKLRATVDCCDAVSDCLQTLGGYGYMEEFRLEKRLRDALTLKTTTPKPDDLRQLLSRRWGGEL